jgi:hypothetical protein
MKNLVLGFVKNYTFEQLRPFVVSLRMSGFTDDVVFLYSDLDASTIKSLSEYGVILVPCGKWQAKWPAVVSSFPRIIQRAYKSKFNPISASSNHYGSLVNILSRRIKGSNYELKSKITANTWENIYCIRFALYYLFLINNREHYASVMLTDVRDVIFQRNPFDFDFGDNLCCFLEDSRIPISKCAFNSNWLLKGFGAETLEALGVKAISCSGINIGSYEAILEYLQVMLDHMLKLKSKHDKGIDQGVHNYILHNRYLKNVRVFENENGPVLTMGHTVDLPHRFNSEGFIVNQNDTVVNVLHQYDRHIENGTLKLIYDKGRLKLATI